MKEQSQSPKLKFLRPDLFKVGAIAGAIAAFILIGYAMVLHGLNLNSFGRWKNINFPLYGLFFAGAMTYFRLKLNDGKMKGPQGILIGVTLNSVATTLYGFLLYVLLSTKGIGQAIIERHKADLKIILIEGKSVIIESLGEAGYEENVKGVEELSAGVLAVDQAIGLLFLGFFLTFLFMLIIKKK
ncbi:hypothetical protein [Flammeovirga sp. EKP202]|uniref:hypothetical protein n=1 Tax=Flammeovirga sp. EKP202 TaxID=2770592 RepID=UPI00165EE351|nr:hypothetical protein [Flammeovirga sp. EKP202]MBD0399875.1 hypothetical protein [Flammeovirga sp. EKP202]